MVLFSNQSRDPWARCDWLTYLRRRRRRLSFGRTFPAYNQSLDRNVWSRLSAVRYMAVFSRLSDRWHRPQRCAAVGEIPIRRKWIVTNAAASKTVPKQTWRFERVCDRKIHM